MTTLSKRSTTSDTMRSAGEFALPRDTSQALAKAAGNMVCGKRRMPARDDGLHVDAA